MAIKKFFITPEQLKTDYAEVKSMIQLAQKYGVSKRLILNYMNRYGIDRKEPAKPPIHILRSMAENQMSSSEIGKIFNLSANYIAQVARENDITITDKFHKGVVTTHNGYLMVRRPEHPHADGKGYMRLHRLIMEEHLGRILDPSELVHHINEDTRDNRIENLCIMSLEDHVRLHHADKQGRGPDKKPRKK